MITPSEECENKGRNEGSLKWSGTTSSKSHREHKCNICSKNLRSSENLRNHMFDHLNFTPFSCDICSTQFVREDQLDKHYRSHFKDDSRHDVSIQMTISDTGRSKKKRQCVVCSKRFKTETLLKRHMSIHSDLKPFSCEFCGKAFKRQDTMMGHLQTHFKGYGLSRTMLDSMPADILRRKFKPIMKKSKICVCDICSKVCNNQNHLKNHMVTHSYLKPFICGVCLKTFKRRDNLKNHFRTIHSGISETYMDSMSANMLLQQNINVLDESKFNCDICSKSFTTKANIRLHMLIHSGLKPFSCEICLKTFRARGQLKKHIRTHEFDSKKLIEIDFPLKNCYVKLKKLD